jgi:hypothetical protein
MLALLRHGVGWADHKGSTIKQLSGQATDGKKALRMKVANDRSIKSVSSTLAHFSEGSNQDQDNQSCSCALA